MRVVYISSYKPHQNPQIIMDKIDEYYDYLVDYNVATEDEICLLFNINGRSIDTLNSILYARTGLRSLEQWRKIELNEYEY
tara:strand:- start:377 stop:619 length:243 start_codon:yes stop_codon:yes gene_type:complete